MVWDKALVRWLCREGDSSDGVKSSSARILDRPVSTVHKNVRNILHCYRYKISHMQELFPSDLPATQALEFLPCMEVDKEWPWRILLNAEANFHLIGYVNCWIWATENSLKIQPVPLHPGKVTVRCRFMALIVIGSYFFKGYGCFVSCYRYRHLSAL